MISSLYVFCCNVCIRSVSKSSDRVKITMGMICRSWALSGVLVVVILGGGFFSTPIFETDFLIASIALQKYSGGHS